MCYKILSRKLSFITSALIKNPKSRETQGEKERSFSAESKILPLLLLFSNSEITGTIKDYKTKRRCICIVISQVTGKESRRDWWVSERSKYFPLHFRIYKQTYTGNRGKRRSFASARYEIRDMNENVSKCSLIYFCRLSKVSRHLYLGSRYLYNTLEFIKEQSEILSHGSQTVSRCLTRIQTYTLHRNFF